MFFFQAVIFCMNKLCTTTDNSIITVGRGIYLFIFLNLCYASVTFHELLQLS